MNDWAKLTATTIADYCRGLESQLSEQNKVLRILNPNPTPYVPPPDTRTKQEKLRDKRLACQHDFNRTKYSRSFCKCRICGIRVTKGFADGYADGFQKGVDHGEDVRGMEE